MKLILGVLAAIAFVFVVALLATGHKEILLHVLGILAIIGVPCAVVYLFVLVLTAMEIDSQD